MYTARIRLAVRAGQVRFSHQGPDPPGSSGRGESSIWTQTQLQGKTGFVALPGKPQRHKGTDHN